MIAVVQRVLKGKVTVGEETVGAIGPGLVVLAAVEAGDDDAEVAWMAGKLIGLRIFRNEAADKDFDLDVRQAGGRILLVSNFTVAAETAKGRRPSLSRAARPEEARAWFDKLVETVRGLGIGVETGRFGADMNVALENDGPATFILRSGKGKNGDAGSAVGDA